MIGGEAFEDWSKFNMCDQALWINAFHREYPNLAGLMVYICKNKKASPLACSVRKLKKTMKNNTPG